MIEKIIEKFEELARASSSAQTEAIIGMQGALANFYNGEKSAYEKAIEIVQEVAKEYGNASDNDLTVVSALPSLYPLQPFEEEAIHKVVVSAKDGGWIPCSERLPQEDEPVTALCEIVNITLKNGAVTVGWCNRFIEKWYVVDEHCDYPVPRKYEDVLAWMPLPSKYESKDAPYQKGELHE